ncbi:uncharacterized protein J3R85_007213 [Psidium guajava]|nr:uncharacterized protein J3R85_007213 [Psidium guajava]
MLSPVNQIDFSIGLSLISLLWTIDLSLWLRKYRAKCDIITLFARSSHLIALKELKPVHSTDHCFLGNSLDKMHFRLRAVAALLVLRLTMDLS